MRDPSSARGVGGLAKSFNAIFAGDDGFLLRRITPGDILRRPLLGGGNKRDVSKAATQGCVSEEHPALWGVPKGT